MRMLLVTATAAAAAAGCSAVPAAPAHRHIIASASITLTKFQACRQLLDEVTRHPRCPRYPSPQAHRTAPGAFILLRANCAQAGVRIPAP